MNVLLVAAHPDDEVLWMWPWALDPHVNKRIIMCSTDIHNPKRPNRMAALAEVCAICDIELVSQVDVNCDFYQLPHRPQPLFQRWCADVSGAVRSQEKWADLIVTHNPHGEYGHPDHRMLFSMVSESARLPIGITDIRVKIPGGHAVAPDASDTYRRIYHQDHYRSCVLQPGSMKQFRSIYERHGAWTWDFEIPERCETYILGGAYGTN